jgi:PIN domain nuclease of toxin-antitoxin system
MFLSIQNNHLFNYNKVPLKEDHRDPFDRLLIATAIEENATIITADEKINLYTDLLKVIG